MTPESPYTYIGPYIGRFAPSPTGPLHAGSLVAALASYLDAKAHAGKWLLRIEDTDRQRCRPEYTDTILRQLQDCGLHWDGEIVFQSQRSAYYESALEQLRSQGHVYPCSCSRKERQSHSLSFSASLYGGQCREGPLNPEAKQFAWRLRTQGELEREVGDFILKRADGLWAYQLAVVVDDAAQGVNHVVRGMDLHDNTPRQIYLQTRLNLPHPHYLHTPLVVGEKGYKLSKQNKAPPLRTHTPQDARAELEAAASRLGLPPCPAKLEQNHAQALAFWVQAWPIALQLGIQNQGFQASSHHDFMKLA
jgi:glutamyl-Q tRNA(Asp) synthetase